MPNDYTPPAEFAHESFTHVDGRVCIWLGDHWFVPLDAGGEGHACERPHPGAIPQTEKVEPKTLDPDELGMHLLRSGVRAASVGEDGDAMLMGHHDDDAAWALYVEFQTYEQGSCDLTVEDREVYDIERRYATFSDHSEGCELVGCGCDDTMCAPCLAGEHDGCTGDCLCAEDYDHRPVGYCTCECGCDEYAWWVNATKSGHEVTWVRWSWAKNRARQLTTPPGERS